MTDKASGELAAPNDSQTYRPDEQNSSAPADESEITYRLARIESTPSDDPGGDK